MTGRPNGTYRIEQDNLPILNQAIDVVRDEVDDRENPPLFRRRPH